MSLSIFRTVHKIRPFSSSKRKFTAGKIIFNKSSNPSGSQIVDVPGLSSECLQVPDSPVGPGAAKNTSYKNPEYFCYNKNSYFEAEVEMLKYRCEQPSTKVPYFQEKK